ncbi:MAG: hypothetical protein IE923_08000 [Micrococcales bacterium]|nr:hypothetical protein [Micrococcales bacterium]
MTPMDTTRHDATGAAAAPSRPTSPLRIIGGVVTGVVGYLAVSAATWAAVEPPHSSGRLAGFGLLVALLAASTVAAARSRAASPTAAGITALVLAFLAAISPERLPDAWINYVLAGGTELTGFVLGACLLAGTGALFAARR